MCVCVCVCVCTQGAALMQLNLGALIGRTGALPHTQTGPGGAAGGDAAAAVGAVVGGGAAEGGGAPGDVSGVGGGAGGSVGAWRPRGVLIAHMMEHRRAITQVRGVVHTYTHIGVIACTGL